MEFRADHIHLYARDVDATARWYEHMFGARIVRSRQSDDRIRTDLQLGGLTIYLGDAAKLQANLGTTLNEATPSPRYGLDHFGLAVDDVEQAAVLLRERGARITKGPRLLRPGAWFFYMDAPDGVTIEILSRDLALDGRPLQEDTQGDTR
jgi:catechol 2,3-dioxygenase-like lactoylglutathione lyase family enzyme